MADEQQVNLLATGTPGANTRLVGYEVGETVCRQYPVDDLLGGDGGGGGGGSTILTGSGVPASGLGSVGDLYIDTVSGDYYLKENETTWGLQGNLMGPAGPAGDPGPAGADGATGPAGPAGPAGDPGPAGADGAAGPAGADGADGSVWHSGSGAPSSGLGVVGDYYIDTASGDYYEKTGASTWTLRGNLVGPQGPAGPAGADGADGAAGADGADGAKWISGPGAPAGVTGVVGDYYLDTDNGDVYEKTGVSTWNQQGNIKGPTGSTGSTGAAGSKWYDGAGAPAGGTGAIGDFYLNTTNGDFYEKTGASTWTLDGNLTGPTATAGALPTGHVEMNTPVGTTSATLVDVTGASCTVTLDTSAYIVAVCSFEVETNSGASSSVIALALNINGTDHAEHQRSLSGASDKDIGAIVHRDGPFAAGTYTVKLRFRRVSGTATPGVNNATICVIGAQGAKGDTGSAGAAGADGADGVKTLTLLAQSYQPPSTNYATFSSRNYIGVLEFDPSTQEAARWVFHLPTGFTYTGGITVKVHWCSSATSGNGRWGARIARLTGVDIDSDSFDTAVEATTATSGTAGLVVVTTLSSVGVDSASAGDAVQLELYRDVGDAADTIDSNDLLVLSVQIELP